MGRVRGALLDAADDRRGHQHRDGALRSIQEDLGIDQARLAWVTNAYTLGFGGVLLLSGRLGDLVGRKRMFLIGLTTFTAASAFAGLAWNQEVLIAMRFIQGTGAGMASPS